jgi:type II secretory pathway predicted ATPase ExeA
MDYLEFYGLRAEPFSNAPVSRFYYDSEQHGQALVRLLYAVRRVKGLAVLSGGIGAGKTTLARRLLDALPDAEFEAALLVIIHRDVTPDWLLRRIAVQLGVVQPPEDKLSLLSQLYRRLVEIYEAGKKAVVLVDEAQMLATRDLMEEFRGLLNLEVPGQKLLSFVFFGLPEIDDCLAMDAPLAQRVALRVRLEPFDGTSTAAYIRHRLRVAGGPETLFSPDAMDAIHRHSEGIPRMINTLCDNALLEGALNRQDWVGPELVDRTAANLGFGRSLGPSASPDPLQLDLPPPPPLPSTGDVTAPMSLPGEPEWPPDEPLDEATAAALEEIDRVLASLSKG